MSHALLPRLTVDDILSMLDDGESDMGWLGHEIVDELTNSIAYYIAEMTSCRYFAGLDGFDTEDLDYEPNRRAVMAWALAVRQIGVLLELAHTGTYRFR